MKKLKIVVLILLFFSLTKKAFALAPVINSVSPDSGHNTTETPITITGKNFDTTCRVYISIEGSSIIGNINTPGYAEGVYISGSYAYIADDSSGLQILDKQSSGTACELVNLVNDTMLTANIPKGLLIPGNYNIKIINSSGEKTISKNYFEVLAISICNITSFSEEGGSITPEGNIKLPFRSNQTFNITPDTGYH